MNAVLNIHKMVILTVYKGGGVIKLYKKGSVIVYVRIGCKMRCVKSYRIFYPTLYCTLAIKILQPFALQICKGLKVNIFFRDFMFYSNDVLLDNLQKIIISLLRGCPRI